MKTTKSCLLLLIGIVAAATSRAQTPWTTNGNAPSANCFIGTTIPVPVIIKSNGTEGLRLEPNGTLKISSLVSGDTTAAIVMPDGSLGKANDPGTGGGDCNLLIWDGDGNAAGPDCFIGTTNPQPFRVYSNGIERMRVTPDGNVVVQGAGAKAPFQVFDHLGVTVNRHDVGVSDVHRSIGFNMYQVNGTQHHYQLGTVAKVEYHSTDGLLQLSVAPSQSADATANFPLGLHIDKLGTAGIGMLPSQGYALSASGNVKVAQGTNTANFVAISHTGTDGKVEVVGGSRLAIVSPSGLASVQQSSNAANLVSIGHNGTDGVLETGGGSNARLQVNVQSAKTVQFGGDILVANHIGVGTTNFFEGNREYKLNVNGQIRAKAAHIYPAWADYVFESGYELMPLDEVEAYIGEHGHLPGMPAGAEVETDGIDVGEMQAKTLEKIEELTLYLLELKRENALLQAEMEELRKEVGK